MTRKRSRANPTSRQAIGWRCASCGRLITRIEDGWVEWLANEPTQDRPAARGLRLVHRTRSASSTGNRCQYDFRREFRNDRSIVEGLPLERFVGADGLMLLLSFLAVGEMPNEEVLELAKRVQIPGYEQARDLFRAGRELGVVVPAIRDGYYLQLEIHRLLRWAQVELQTNREQSISRS